MTHLVRGDVAAKPQAMLNLAPQCRSHVARGLRKVVEKHPDVARKFAFDIADATPVVMLNCHNSKSHGGGMVFVNRCPCLTASMCKGGGPWVANLNRRTLLSEMETLQGIPNGRLNLPSVVTRSKYGQMIGNGFIVGVIGRVALRLLKTVGLLPLTWRDHWADEAEVAK